MPLYTVDYYREEMILNSFKTKKCLTVYISYSENTVLSNAVIIIKSKLYGNSL